MATLQSVRRSAGVSTSRSVMTGALIIAMAAPAFATAQADEAPIGESIAVSWTDLDLSRPHDAAKLHERIRRAARAVCNPQRLDVYLPLLRGYHDCYRRTVDDATARAEEVIARRVPRWMPKRAPRLRAE
jgi:UrcA family protein